LVLLWFSEYPAEKLTSRAYWANALIDMPLLGMDTNACNYTTCPVEANKPYTYTFGLNIADFFPIVSITIILFVHIAVKPNRRIRL